MLAEEAIKEELRVASHIANLLRGSGESSEYVAGIVNALKWVLQADTDNPIHPLRYVN